MNHHLAPFLRRKKRSGLQMDKRFLYTGSFWTHYKEIKINSQVKMKLSICIFFTSYCNCNKIHLAFQYQKTISFDIYMGADKSLARPGRKQANVSVRMAWFSFGALPCRGKKNLMTARVSMLLKSRTSLTCFRACSFLVVLRTYQHPDRKTGLGIGSENKFTWRTIS